MGSLFCIYVLVLISLRFIAGYDSKFQCEKYVIIKKTFLRKILIDKMSFDRGNRLSKDIDKMNLGGFILYIVAFFVFLLNLVFLCFVPAIPTTVFSFETQKVFVYLDTLNEKISAIGIFAFICLFFLYVACRMVEIAMLGKTKWGKIGCYLFGIVLAVVTLCCFVGVFLVS